MENYFLLIAGSSYYPCKGTIDWKGTFPTKEAAEQAVKIVERADSNYKQYIIDGEKDNWEYDWYEIIDLRDWINKC